jgi:pilus assembly protein CpaD
MRSLTIFPAVALGLALAGCMGGGRSDATINRSLDSVHQPVVRVDSFIFDADARSGNLSPMEQRRINDWFDALGVRYGDRIAIDAASGSAPRAARDELAMMVARRGMMLADHSPITEGAIPAGHMRIVLTRATARVEGCPDWGTRTAVFTNANTTSNYGCANNANLAAMVADATDLVSGQRSNTNDPLTASKAIEAYRTAPPTGAGGLSNTNTGGGGGGGGGN